MSVSSVFVPVVPGSEENHFLVEASPTSVLVCGVGWIIGCGQRLYSKRAGYASVCATETSARLLAAASVSGVSSQTVLSSFGRNRNSSMWMSIHSSQTTTESDSSMSLFHSTGQAEQRRRSCEKPMEHSTYLFLHHILAGQATKTFRSAPCDVVFNVSSSSSSFAGICVRFGLCCAAKGGFAVCEDLHPFSPLTKV